MNVRKIIAGASTALLVSGGLVLGTVLPANATGYHDCVPSEAWTEVITPEVPATEGTPAIDAVYETVVVKEAGWQRYSYKGHWNSNTEAPAFPGHKWQANTASDPHGVGVEGAYFRSNGNSGHGDWFYLEATPEVTEQVLISEAVPAVPGTPAIPAVTVEHEAVTCDEEPEVVENALYLSHELYCGGVDITLRNVSPWIYPTSVKIDGVHSYGPTVDNRTGGTLSGPQKDASKTRSITFAEDSGEHTVEYRIDAGSENSLYLGTPLNEWVTLTVDSDCEVNVPEQPEPVVVVTTADTTDCEAGTVTTTTTTTTTGWVYEQSSNSWVEGEAEVTTESTTREATEEECPTPVVPEEPEEPVVPATPEEPAAPTAERLATTYDPPSYLPVLETGGLISLLVGGLALVGAGIRRRMMV